MSDISIRTATPDDLDAVMAIEQRAHSHPWAASVMAGYLQKSQRVWLLGGGQHLYGHAVLHQAGPDAELLTIAIDPAAQGKGYGRQLLTFVIERAQQQQAEQLFLEVRESNRAAIALYEQLGFCQVGNRRGYYPGAEPGEREDALLYCLPLLQSQE